MNPPMADASDFSQLRSCAVRPMSRREAIKSLVGLSGLIFLTACGRRGTAEANAITITLWTLEENLEMPDIYQQIADEFMAQNPSVKIAIERRTNDAYKEALRLAINTPAAPDGYFSWSGVGLGGFYIRAGGAAPLTPYYEKYRWNDRFIAPALSATHFNGIQYGIPFRVRGMGLYFRKDAFARAGIASLPTTYAELLEVNRKLRASGQTPLAMGGKFGWMVMRLMDSLLETTCGATKHDALRALNADWSKEPGVTAAYIELRRWADEKFLTPDFLGIDPANVRTDVYQGKAAMMYEGDWMIEYLKNDEMNLEDYDFFPFPTETGRLAFFSEMFFIGRTSPHADVMAQFYDFWSSPATQARHVGKLGTIPPTVNVHLPENSPAQAKKWQDIVSRCTGTYIPADQALPLEIFGSYLRIQAQVIAGTLRPEAAGAAMQADINVFKSNQSPAPNSARAS